MKNKEFEENEITFEMFADDDFEEALFMFALKPISPCTIDELFYSLMDKIPIKIYSYYISKFDPNEFIILNKIFGNIEYKDDIISLNENALSRIEEDYFEDFSIEQIKLLKKLSR